MSFKSQFSALFSDHMKRDTTKSSVIQHKALESRVAALESKSSPNLSGLATETQVTELTDRVAALESKSTAQASHTVTEQKAGE